MFGQTSNVCLPRPLGFSASLAVWSLLESRSNGGLRLGRPVLEVILAQMTRIRL